MPLRTLSTAAFAFTMNFLQALAFAGISNAEEDMRDQFRSMCEEDGGKVTISGGRLVCTIPTAANGSACQDGGISAKGSLHQTR